MSNTSDSMEREEFLRTIPRGLSTARLSSSSTEYTRLCRRLRARQNRWAAGIGLNLVDENVFVSQDAAQTIRAAVSRRRLICVKSAGKLGGGAPVLPWPTNDGRGWSTRAAARIARGTIVAILLGQVRSTQPADFMNGYVANLAYVQRGLVLDPRQTGSVISRANHSCDPNTIFMVPSPHTICVLYRHTLSPYLTFCACGPVAQQGRTEDNLPCIAVKAIKEINVGDEVTVDYAAAVPNRPCLCGALRCRGLF